MNSLKMHNLTEKLLIYPINIIVINIHDCTGITVMQNKYLLFPYYFNMTLLKEPTPFTYTVHFIGIGPKKIM